MTPEGVFWQGKLPTFIKILFWNPCNCIILLLHHAVEFCFWFLTASCRLKQFGLFIKPKHQSVKSLLIVSTTTCESQLCFLDSSSLGVPTLLLLFLSVNTLLAKILGCFFFSLCLPIIFVLETNWRNISVLFLDTFSFLINKCQQPGAYEQPYSNKRMYTAGSTQFAKEKQINISGFWGLFVNNRTFKNINLVVIAFISAFSADSLATSLHIMEWRSSYWKSF